MQIWITITTAELTGSLLSAGGDLTSPSGQWWAPPAGLLIGGALGVSIGVGAGAAGLLAGRGKNRKLAVALILSMLIVGTLSLGGAAVALADGQPVEVFYPLIFPGFIASLLSALIIRPVRKRYRKLEVKKLKDIGP